MFYIFFHLTVILMNCPSKKLWFSFRKLYSCYQSEELIQPRYHAFSKECHGILTTLYHPEFVESALITDAS